MKIYTRGGDTGQTSLGDGSRLSKGDDRIEAYGTIDELNSWIGLLLAAFNGIRTGRQDLVHDILVDIQNIMFEVGSGLALPGSRGVAIPPHLDKDISRLESTIDLLEKDLPPLTAFILPGGPEAAGTCHMVRTVCRRAERLMVRLNDAHPGQVNPGAITWLNRLSDFFFVLARWITKELQCEEVLWNKDRRT